MAEELDPKVAFSALQELYGIEMGRMAAELAAKSAESYQLRQQLTTAQERITALEQELHPHKHEIKQGGADLKSLDLQPKSPIKKVADGA